MERNLAMQSGWEAQPAGGGHGLNVMESGDSLYSYLQAREQYRLDLLRGRRLQQQELQHQTKIQAVPAKQNIGVIGGTRTNSFSANSGSTNSHQIPVREVGIERPLINNPPGLRYDQKTRDYEVARDRLKRAIDVLNQRKSLGTLRPEQYKHLQNLQLQLSKINAMYAATPQNSSVPTQKQQPVTLAMVENRSNSNPSVSVRSSSAMVANRSSGNSNSQRLPQLPHEMMNRVHHQNAPSAQPIDVQVLQAFEHLKKCIGTLPQDLVEQASKPLDELQSHLIKLVIKDSKQENKVCSNATPSIVTEDEKQTLKQEVNVQSETEAKEEEEKEQWQQIFDESAGESEISVWEVAGDEDDDQLGWIWI